MPTRNVGLTAEQDAFVKRVDKTGKYQNASEAIRDALRVLEQKHHEDPLRLKALRPRIGAGLDQPGTERVHIKIREDELGQYLEGLAATPTHNARRSVPAEATIRVPGRPPAPREPPAGGNRGIGPSVKYKQRRRLEVGGKRQRKLCKGLEGPTVCAGARSRAMETATEGGKAGIRFEAL